MSNIEYYNTKTEEALTPEEYLEFKKAIEEHKPFRLSVGVRSKRTGDNLGEQITQINEEKRPTLNGQKDDNQSDIIHNPFEGIIDKNHDSAVVHETLQNYLNATTLNYQKQADNSVVQKTDDPKTFIKRNRFNKKKVPKEVIRGLLAIILAASLAASGSKVVKAVNEQNALLEAETSISAMAMGTDSSTMPSILSSNTHRTQNLDGYWYDYAGMTQDILKLPSEYQDVALYTIYNRMHNDENFTQLIKLVGEKSGQNYTSINNYLMQKGWVDKDGKPSREVYKEYGHNAINEYNKRQKEGQLSESLLTAEINDTGARK